MKEALTLTLTHMYNNPVHEGGLGLGLGLGMYNNRVHEGGGALAIHRQRRTPGSRTGRLGVQRGMGL